MQLKSSATTAPNAPLTTTTTPMNIYASAIVPQSPQTTGNVSGEQDAALGEALPTIPSPAASEHARTGSASSSGSLSPGGSPKRTDSAQTMHLPGAWQNGPDDSTPYNAAQSLIATVGNTLSGALSAAGNMAATFLPTNVVSSLDDEFGDHCQSPVLNTIESLKRGIINTSGKGTGEFTILLVGETGTGKSSLLEFMANVLGGVGILDHSNEMGGSQSSSQTKYAKLYEFKSRNGVQVRILDTPGLADTGGIDQDESHKKSIAEEIKAQVAVVNGVLILANGTLAPPSVITEYTLTTLTSIFPKSLADNIALMFTYCASPLNINFADEAVPHALEKAPQFYIDNPLALLKQYNKMCEKFKKRNNMTPDLRGQSQLSASLNHVKNCETAALQTMVKLFDWMDGLNPQPTTEILEIFNQSQDIAQNISDIISQMEQATVKRKRIEKIRHEIELGKADITSWSKFEQTISTKIWKQVPTSYYNTLCTATGCKSVCHQHCTCQIPFSLNPQDLRDCTAMDRRSDQDIRCKRCSHALDMHWHWRFEWKEVDETQISIDDGMKAKWEGARDKKAKKEAILAAIEKTPANLDVVVERNMITLAELASTYASMSLSGSFSAHLEHAVKMHDLKLRALREDNADSEQLRRVEASAAELKSKLNVLRDAKAKAQKG